MLTSIRRINQMMSTANTRLQNALANNMSDEALEKNKYGTTSQIPLRV